MRLAIVVTTMLWGLLAAGQSSADSPDIPSAYVVVAEDNGIPPAILYAVASAESVVNLNAGRRPWPWTLNVAGESMRFGDRVSACAALLDALARTRLVDVGIAQLNYRWQPQLFGEGQRFADPCAGLDPYANLDEAANLIRQHYEASGDWLIAAGRYHRPAGGEPAARYRETVRKELARLGRTPSLGTACAGISMASHTPSSRPATAAIAKIDPVASTGDASLIWITPSPRTTDADVTWITPSPRRWMAEVASR